MLASEAPRLRLGAPLARIFVSWICSELPIILSSSVRFATFVPFAAYLVADFNKLSFEVLRVEFVWISGRIRTHKSIIRAHYVTVKTDSAVVFLTSQPILELQQRAKFFSKDVLIPALKDNPVSL